MVCSHQNIGTRTNYTGCGGHVLGYSGLGASSVASGYLNVDDEASSLVSWAMMVTLDVTVYSSCLGAGKVPPCKVLDG
jgi:hypothetical protein